MFLLGQIPARRIRLPENKRPSEVIQAALIMPSLAHSDKPVRQNAQQLAQIAQSLQTPRKQTEKIYQKIVCIVRCLVKVERINPRETQQQAKRYSQSYPG